MIRLALLLLMFFTSVAHGYVFNFGYRVHQANADLRVSSQYYDQELITDYILNHMAGSESESKRRERAQEVSFLIKTVSEHFKVDPLYYLSLIRMESAFYYIDNLSNSGAVGLTQFVQVGMKEVFAQLGFLNDSNASEASRKFFEKAYEGMRVAIKDRYTYIKFKELKESLKKFNLNRSSDLKQFKGIFKENIPIQIIFGAVFLKTLVGRQCDKEDRTTHSYCLFKSPYGNNSYKNKLNGFYRLAFIGYNGEKTPISYCSVGGKVLKVEQNFMRFCYAAKINYWAKELNEKMKAGFDKYKKKLNHIYIPRIVDRFLNLNDMIESKMYHKRSFNQSFLSNSEKILSGGCDLSEEKLSFYMENESINHRQGIYSQSRSYTVPTCHSNGEKETILYKKVELDIEYDFRNHHVRKVEYKNSSRGMSYNLEPRGNIESYLESRVSEFMENDLVLGDSYIRVKDYGQRSAGIHESHYIFDSSLSGINPKSGELTLYQTQLSYDVETSQFTLFECKKTEN